MPYRIEVHGGAGDALDRLVELGALDVEQCDDGIAALIPDEVPPEAVARQLGVPAVTVHAATPRDEGSVWRLSSGEVRAGRIRIVSSTANVPEDALRLIDSPVFGSGHHPTTALCIEALDELLGVETVACMLDVGTGSGVLALAALRLGVPRVMGLDIDPSALETAGRNARLNQLHERVELLRGGPETVEGQWPLVVANILAAPLIEMAPMLTRRVASRGYLILSGVRGSMAADVIRPYRHLGMRPLDTKERAGWSALLLQASW